MARSASMTEEEQGIQPAVSNSDDERGESEDEGGGDGRKRKARKSTGGSKKKMLVMKDSGQTDVERRELRHEQRNLQRRIETMGDEIKDINSDAFQTASEENNSLWKKVHYVREAVLDGENMEMIGAKVIRQVDALIQVPRYDAARLAQRLRSKCSVTSASGSTIFDWKNLGIECGSCFNCTPKVYFLAGPIHAAFVPKEKRKIVRKPKVIDEEEEEKAEDVKQTKGSNKDSNNLAAAEKHVRDLVTLLQQRSKEEKEKTVDKLQKYGDKLLTENAKTDARHRAEKNGDRVCAVNFLFNPKSFTQTVENIFSLSFLVKESRAEIGVRDPKECEKHPWDESVVPGPYIKSLKHDDSINQGTHEESRQAIIRLNMKDWRKMCAAYQVQTSDIPNRPIPKRSK